MLEGGPSENELEEWGELVCATGAKGLSHIAQSRDFDLPSREGGVGKDAYVGEGERSELNAVRHFWEELEGIVEELQGLEPQECPEVQKGGDDPVFFKVDLSEPRA